MHILGVIFLFTLVYFAFNPGGAPPTFNGIFEFAYNVIIKPLEVLASIKDGLGEFLSNLVSWFNSLF